MKFLVLNANQTEFFDRDLSYSGVIGKNHNYYGDIIEVDTDKKTFMGIMCDCGGSMYLCQKHAIKLWKEGMNRTK